MNNLKNDLERKPITILVLVYAVLLVYASLMPYNFSSDIHFSDQFSGIWKYWPINPHARISGADIVSNLLLYIPLGLLLSLRLFLGRFSAAQAFIIAFLACSVLSAGIEFFQMYTLSRISSASDWLFNSVSGLMGAAAGVTAGPPAWEHGILWLKAKWKNTPVMIGTLALMMLMAADALSPFLPSILLKHIGRSIRSSFFELSQGLMVHPWHWWIVQRLLLYGLLTVLLTACLKPYLRRHRAVQAAVLAVLFGFVLEFSKLFILSRVFNIANICVSSFGCAAAVLIIRSTRIRLSPERQLDTAIIMLIFYIFYMGWFPFDFQSDTIKTEAFLTPVKWLPLYDYAMGASLNHARLFMQSLFMLAVLIYIIRVRYGWFSRSTAGGVSAFLFCGFLGFLQEAGQMFLVSRTPSTTDIYCFAVGGFLGVLVRRPPGHKMG